MNFFAIRAFSLALATLWFTATAIAPARLHAQAQAPAPVPAAKPSGTILGRVTDTLGLVLPEADINIYLSETDSTVATGKSDPGGRIRMTGIPVGGPYTLIARKIGYAPAQWSAVEFHGNDTLRITFRLPLAPAVLPEVVTTAKGATAASRRITATQFDAGKVNNALFVLGRYRPDMLGDPTVCTEPPQPIWRQQEQSQAQAESTRLFGAGTFNSRGADATPRRWWLDSLYNVRTDPYSPHVLRVYVNGIRRDYPGQSPLAVLRYIPSDQVKEMYYADCKDTSVPIDMRYSLFVVLNPPTPEEQQQVLKRLMLPDSVRANSDTTSSRGSTSR